MARKSMSERELEKIRAVLAKDVKFSEVVKQVSEIRKEAKSVKPASSERLRLPYIDAKPLNVRSWK